MLFLIPCWGVSGPARRRSSGRRTTGRTERNVRQRRLRTFKNEAEAQQRPARTLRCRGRSSPCATSGVPRTRRPASVVGVQRGELVSRLEGRGGGERAEHGALLAHPAAEGAAAGEGGAQGGHDGSFRLCCGSSGLAREQWTSKISASGVKTDRGSSRRISAITRSLSRCTVAVNVVTSRAAA